MIPLKGKHTNALFTIDDIEEECLSQVVKMTNHFAFTKPIVLMPDCHAGKGSCIGFTMEMGEYVIPNIVGVDIGCTDKDTEFLSPNGWIKISDWKNQKVMQYNPETKTGSFTPPLRYIKKPCKEFIHFKTKYGVDQMLSKDHRCLIYKYDRSGTYQKSEVISAKEIYEKHNELKLGFRDRFETSFILDDNKEGLAYSDTELRLIVAASADGHYEDKSVYFKFKKTRKVERLLDLFNSLQLDYSHSKDEDKEIFNFRCHPPTMTKGLEQFWKANKRQLKVICDELLYWDGNEKEQCFYTRKEEEADFVNYAFSAIGNRSTIQIDKRESGIDYRVFKLANTKIGIAGTPKTEMKIVPSSDGYQYCFTVPSSFLVLRRNGNVFITGNCGMLGWKYEMPKDLDLPQLDKDIRSKIPFGTRVRDQQDNKFTLKEGHPIFKVAHQQLTKMWIGLRTKFGNNVTEPPEVNFKWWQEKCNELGLDWNRAQYSIGTLGGGNHFIELGKSSRREEWSDYKDKQEEKDYLWIIIHSGSRKFGKEVAEFYQDIAIKRYKAIREGDFKERVTQIKATCNQKEYGKKISELRRELNMADGIDMKGLETLTKEDMYNYLYDMVFAQVYATYNRECMMTTVRDIMKLGQPIEEIETIHNFISPDDLVIRKGAVHAPLNEKLIIPFNMRDGSWICTGQGNKLWNNSAPHGAGRIMSRSKAKKELSQEEAEKQMEGIYTSCIPLDEAPNAYKSADMIKGAILPTAKIVEEVKPIMNLKDGLESKWQKKNS